jgi:hypothetical protein
MTKQVNDKYNTDGMYIWSKPTIHQNTTHYFTLTTCKEGIQATKKQHNEMWKHQYVRTSVTVCIVLYVRKMKTISTNFMKEIMKSQE